MCTRCKILLRRILDALTSVPNTGYRGLKALKIKELTGAGDLFAGGFLHGLINSKSVKESLETGTEMSSKVIQIIGARLN